MLSFRGEQVVRVRATRHMLNDETCFFSDLAHGALFDGLAEFQVTTRKRPRARPMRASSLSEKHEITAQDDDSYANFRGRLLHGLRAP